MKFSCELTKSIAIIYILIYRSGVSKTTVSSFVNDCTPSIPNIPGAQLENDSAQPDINMVSRSLRSIARANNKRYNVNIGNAYLISL